MKLIARLRELDFNFSELPEEIKDSIKLLDDKGEYNEKEELLDSTIFEAIRKLYMEGSSSVQQVNREHQKEISQINNDGFNTDVPPYSSKSINILKQDKDTITLYHGTSSVNFDKFKGDIVYLAENSLEARGFALDNIIGGGRGKGTPRLLKVIAPKGEIKDINEQVENAIMNEDDIKIFYGETDKYFENLYKWINKI